MPKASRDKPIIATTIRIVAITTIVVTIIATVIVVGIILRVTIILIVVIIVVTIRITMLGRNQCGQEEINVVVVKITVPFLVPIIIQHPIFRVPKKGP